MIRYSFFQGNVQTYTVYQYIICLHFFSVFKETQPCQHCEVEGSYSWKWPVVFCVWVHEREFVPDDERQVNSASVSQNWEKDLVGIKMGTWEVENKYKCV